jgi:hypothetical protein
MYYIVFIIDIVQNTSIQIISCVDVFDLTRHVCVIIYSSKNYRMQRQRNYMS